jgi:thiamine-phosphate pyrophosphorylase
MPEGRTDGAGVRRMRAARLTGLYAVTPDIADTAVLVRKVAAALDGGAAVVQYRNKAATPALRLTQARALARLLAGGDALFIVNDDVELAVAVEADGVHLGEHDPGVETARVRLGAEPLIGVSCYDDWQLAREAVDAGADYVAFGSFFASATKPAARRADRGLLQRARTLGVPVVAIGGITAANAQALMDAGATALAVVSDVFAHDDPADITRAAAALSRGLAAAPRHCA